MRGDTTCRVPVSERQAGHPQVRCTTMLHVADLVKDYGEFLALKGISLDLAPGTVTALVGHNGAGKSTLLRIVAGLLEPTSGTVEIDGHAPDTMEARAGNLLHPRRTRALRRPVGARTPRIHRPAPRCRGGEPWADYLLDRLGLAHRSGDLPSRFSRGLRQRASLAVGFVRPYHLLMVDEPFVGLDASSCTALMDLLTDAAAEGAAVLVSTHDLPFVERSDACIAMRDGSIVANGKLTVADVIGLVS